jgi:hypothetical protein
MVTVKQNEEAPIAVEIMAESIVAISQGIKKLRTTRLNDRALFLLIQNASPSVGNYPPKKVTIGEIKAVLEGIESLEKTFLKKKA